MGDPRIVLPFLAAGLAREKIRIPMEADAGAEP
jgi:hypothetical protein